MFHQFENTKWLVARNPCGGERSRSLARKSKTVFTTFRGVSLIRNAILVLVRTRNATLVSNATCISTRPLVCSMCHYVRLPVHLDTSRETSYRWGL